jgi:DNA-3-methyladenine glycosylase
MRTLPRSFFEQNTVLVAQQLLGVLLVSHAHKKTVMGRIVETEAYCGLIDPASHAYIGKTKRNAALFGPVGHAYVYLIYGLHTCLNVVSHPKNESGGVLIRAIEPLEGIDIMQERRGDVKLKDLTNGPSKVGQAFGITLKDNDTDLTAQKSPLYLLHDPRFQAESLATKRIGITKNADVLWRFIIPQNPWVSR